MISIQPVNEFTGDKWWVVNKYSIQIKADTHKGDFHYNVISMKKLILWVIVLIYLCVGLFYLDTLPAEWFGDVSISHNYTVQILAGKFPYQFTTSVGPTYHYLIAPIISILGTSYYAYKFSSLLLGMIGIICISELGREIGDEDLGILSAFVAALSFWYLVWSRLGSSPQMILPTLSSLTVLGILKYQKNKNFLMYIIGCVSSVLGLFTYPGVFLLPLVWVCLSILFVKSFKLISFSMIVIFLSLSLFAYVLSRDQDNFLNTYMGKKISNAATMTSLQIMQKTGHNALKTIGMLHFKGDEVFRWNVPYSPHLDAVSGIFFIIGLINMFNKHRRGHILYLLLPMLILPLPSIWPGHPAGEVPQAGRTFAIVPMVFILVASGIQSCYVRFKHLSRLFAYFALTAILITISVLNLYKYFYIYPKTLPLSNISVTQPLSRVLDAQSPTTKIYIPRCCWLTSDHLSYDAIINNMHNSVNKGNLILEANIQLICTQFAQYPKMVVLPFNDYVLLTELKKCIPNVSSQDYFSGSTPTFTLLKSS